jgi:four helix bundle protein
MATTRFTQLKVWQAAHEVTLAVYKLTPLFPMEERFCLAQQMRKASVSIAANIAEGYGRRSPADKAHFYTISEGSAEELKYYLILARDLSYIDPVPELASRLDEVSRMLWGLIQRTLHPPGPGF